MTKLEKVIKGLECCQAMDDGGFPSCGECPYESDGGCAELDVLHKDALELLKEKRPTVDAVPVVRCSECKHYKSVLCPLSMADGYYWPAHNPDFFCADGERREE